MTSRWIYPPGATHGIPAEEYITADQVRRLYHYDPSTGHLSRKDGRRGRVRGASSQRYEYVTINGRKYLAHRVIWLLVYGRFPPQEIDHIDRNGRNNKIENLRCASRAQNGANRGKQRNNTSGRKGVSFHKASRKWRATISASGIVRHLGVFESADDAQEAYARAAADLYAEFARAA